VGHERHLLGDLPNGEADFGADKRAGLAARALLRIYNRCGAISQGIDVAAHGQNISGAGLNAEFAALAVVLLELQLGSHVMVYPLT
jgi:hypothetical protein